MPERINDPNFTDASNWSITGGGVAVTGGQLYCTDPTSLYFSEALSLGRYDFVPGVTYRYKVVVAENTLKGLDVFPFTPVQAYMAAGEVVFYDASLGGTGVFKGEFVAKDTTPFLEQAFYMRLLGKGKLVIDSVSIKEAKKKPSSPE